MSAAQSAPIRIIIVDDHAIVRAGLRMLIDQSTAMKVVGMAGTGAEGVAIATLEQPDIVLLDVALGEEDGLALLPKFREVASNARVLVLTGLRGVDIHQRAIREGAMGVVLKDDAAEVLIKAINKVYQGEVWVDRLMMGSLLHEILQAKKENPERARIALLTDREREVIALVGEGLKNKQIAGRLFISETTVTHHLSSVFSKLGVTDRLELMIFAFRHGLAKVPR